MGGYGALLLAERISGAAAARRTTPAAGGVPAVAAVAAMSPAIFATYADARSADVRAFGGCHDDAFWLRNLPTALSFIEGHLA